MNALLIDFDDSFVFNIKSSLEDLGVSVDVINYEVYADILSHSYDFTILGPGPGHPNDYSQFINDVDLNEHKFIGICLGHQLLLSKVGFNVIRTEPVHGQSREVEFPSHYPLHKLRNKTLLVQYYNSLKVEALGTNDDLYLEGNLFLNSSTYSMQFHPESIGTSCPLVIFESILEWVYNYGDEQP